jgi:putative transposase
MKRTSQFYTAVKVRLYPCKEQAQLFHQTIGNCRWIYNHFLALRIKHYQDYKKWKSQNRNRTAYVWPKLPTEAELKKDHVWLSISDATAIQQARIDLEVAFKKFFKGETNHPKFHRKGYKNSFRCVMGISMDGKFLKIGKNGWVPCRGSLGLLKGKLKSVTVSLEAGKWYASVLQEVSADDYCEPVDHPRLRCGIDLGIVRPLTITDGTRFGTLGLTAKKRLEKLELRRKRYQRQMQRKQRGSSNREKARRKLQIAYKRERDVRKDFIEQASHKLTSTFQKIVFEDLNFKSMTRRGKSKSKLNRGLLSMGLSRLIERVQDKAIRRGCEVVFVDSRYTSQTCSSCGSINKESRKSQSRFQCVDCGFRLNADRNAALNVLARAK